MPHLKRITWPDFGAPDLPPPLSLPEMEARLGAIRRRMQIAGYSHLVLYADREHSANMLWATGFDPRFEEALLFVTSTGGPMRPATLHAAWQRACRRVGVEGLRFHDLRHTGNTLAAATGASTKELMARMGHASARAALIYQHATRDRDAAIADSLSTMVNDALQRKRSS